MAAPGWCSGGGAYVGSAYGRGARTPRPRARHVRCGVCGRRLRQRVRECHDPGCWHIAVPAHKARARRPRSPGREARRARRI